MFKTKHRIVCGMLLLMLCTCSRDRQSPHVSQTPANTANKGDQKDFLDSVAAKMKFTYSRIKDYTNLDSASYKQHVRFSGDTVWFRNGSRPLAVIRYAVGGMNKKLLLVFNRHGECTASLMVGMDGDIDGGFDSVFLDYKIIDDNSFQTIETWTYKGGKKYDEVTVTKQFYHINKKGSILAQDNIIRSFNKPKVMTVKTVAIKREGQP